MKSSEMINNIKTLLNIEVKLEEMKLENGTVVEAESFEKGKELFIKTDDERVAMPVGEYLLEDGRLVVVEEEGIIADVREVSDEVPAKGLARQLDIPIWSVSQVNRAGANDNVIQGDKAAGSYDKIMITDFCMSLSRKKEDKVNNTGRFHLMKNRYGMDGLTFGIEADTSTGHFIVKNEYIEGDESESMVPTTRSNKFDTDVDKFDKQLLQKKFFELNS